MSKPPFVVESGIPVPSTQWRTNVKYPWERLSVGDSVFIDCLDINSKRHVTPYLAAQTVKSSTVAFRHAHQPSWKFIVRTVENGCRVWRTE